MALLAAAPQILLRPGNASLLWLPLAPGTVYIPAVSSTLFPKRLLQQLSVLHRQAAQRRVRQRQIDRARAGRLAQSLQVFGDSLHIATHDWSAERTRRTVRCVILDRLPHDGQHTLPGCCA